MFKHLFNIFSQIRAKIPFVPLCLGVFVLRFYSLPSAPLPHRVFALSLYLFALRSWRHSGSIFLHLRQYIITATAAASSRILAIFSPIRQQLSRFSPRIFRNSAAVHGLPAHHFGCNCAKFATVMTYCNISEVLAQSVVLPFTHPSYLIPIFHAVFCT